MGKTGSAERSQSGAARLIPPDRFTIGGYFFTLRLCSPIFLPVDRGDLFHRALGKGLERVSPSFGRWFYRPVPSPAWPDSHQTPPKPFMLIPPAIGGGHKAGELLELGVNLFGVAQQHLPIVFAALEALGRDGGLTNPQARFEIAKLSQHYPGKTRTLYDQGRWIAESRKLTAAQILSDSALAANRITLHFPNGLRLKHQGHLVQQDLKLSTFIERLLGRINTLAAMYCGGHLLPPEEKTALITLARAARRIDDQTQWRDPDKTPEDIRFAGMLGHASWKNVPAVLLPWLNLGQWTGVGGKTSFGLGRYTMEITE